MNYLIADHDSYSRPGSSSGGVAPGKESAEISAGLHFWHQTFISYRHAAVSFMM
jgi:hypothetical protein